MDSEVYDQYQAQEALQQQQLDANQSLYAPQLQEQVQQAQAVLVEQTNPKTIVKDILLRLRGLDERPDGSYVRVAEPILNKLGQEKIWFILESHINQNVILSSLERNEISNMMDALSDDLVDDLSLNWKSYGVKKKTDLDIINNSVLTNIFLALKRAEGRNEKNWIGKISVENISAGNRLPAVKKEGFWSKFRL